MQDLHQGPGSLAEPDRAGEKTSPEPLSVLATLGPGARLRPNIRSLSLCGLVSLLYLSGVVAWCVLLESQSFWDFELFIWLLSSPFLTWGALWVPTRALRPDSSLEARHLSTSESIVTTLVGLTGLIAGFWFIDEGIGNDLFVYVALMMAISVICCVIAYRRWTVPLPFQVEALVLQGPDLDTYAERILSSDRFLKALQSSLPRIERKDDGSLDHLPFLLSTVRARRVGFERSSQAFFFATLLFGMVAAVIVIWYGFVLVDQVGIGVQRHVETISRDLDLLADQRADYDGLLLESDELALSAREKKVWLAAGLDSEEYYTDCLPARDPGYLKLNAAKDDSIVPLTSPCSSALGEIILRLGDLPESEQQEVFEILQRKKEVYEAIEQGVRRNIARRFDLVERVEAAVEKIEAGTVTGEWRVYELLKRIAIGLIVVSFLLAILRYLSRQYSEHLALMTAADRDDMAIRRFFVAIANAENTEERSATLQQFIRNAGSSLESVPPHEATDGPRSLTDIEKKLLGDTLEVLKARL